MSQWNWEISRSWYKFWFCSDKYFEAYEEVASCFKHISKDNILRPYTEQGVLRTEITEGDGFAIGYEFYVFDLLYQKEYNSGQPINVQINRL